MKEINVHEAKTHLSKLLERVEMGEEITIARSGVPVARLVPVNQPRVRELGIDQGRIHISPDFDAPLPSEIMNAFLDEGEGKKGGE